MYKSGVRADGTKIGIGFYTDDMDVENKKEERVCVTIQRLLR